MTNINNITDYQNGLHKELLPLGSAQLQTFAAGCCETIWLTVKPFLEINLAPADLRLIIEIGDLLWTDQSSRKTDILKYRDRIDKIVWPTEDDNELYLIKNYFAIQLVECIACALDTIIEGSLIPAIRSAMCLINCIDYKYSMLDETYSEEFKTSFNHPALISEYHREVALARRLARGETIGKNSMELYSQIFIKEAEQNAQPDSQ